MAIAVRSLASLLIAVALASGAAFAQPAAAPAATGTAPTLGPGDGLEFRVYGQPDLDARIVVGEDGSVPVPLVGPVSVTGLSPAAAAKRIEAELRKGKYLRNPVVMLTLTDPRSQRVSVIGEVGTPGRYPIDGSTTVIDLLAEAGGIRETGSYTVYVLRPAPDGGPAERLVVDLKGLRDPAGTFSQPVLRGGDSVVVPPAETFSVYGEVKSPGTYRLVPGMTVLEAIAQAGGPTARGSDRRLEIRRRVTGGGYDSDDAKPSDVVRPDDVIRVKERIF